MLMTEEQARETWCPFVRIALDYGDYATAGNRGWADKTDHLYKDCRCLASKCMAWRWSSFKTVDGQMPCGYCGLAGKPD